MTERGSALPLAPIAAPERHEPSETEREQTAEPPLTPASLTKRRLDRRLVHLKDHHLKSLEAIRCFLREHSSYDVLPVSFRLVVLDTKLTIKAALDVMWQAGVVSAPLWQSTLPDGPSNPAVTHDADPRARPGFAGLLTVNDVIHLIQYYYQTSMNYDRASLDVETFRVERLREIEQSLNVPPLPMLSIGPLHSLAEAAQVLVRTHARRIPLVDHDEDLGLETVISVLTQYRLLKFIAMNCSETSGLRASIASLGIGAFTYEYIQARKQRVPAASTRLKMPPLPPSDAGPHYPIQVATLDTTVFDAVHMFSEQGISGVPIVDEQGDVVDVYEAVDVITLVRTGDYHSLDFTIRQALERRPPDYTGVACCSPDDSLASVFALLRQRRVHRLLVLDPSADTQRAPSEPTRNSSSLSDEEGATGVPMRSKGRLVGLLCLSDLLRYIVEGEGANVAA